MAVTPNRRIVLEVDGPEYSTVLRPSFRTTWGAAEMSKADGWVARVNPDGSQSVVDGNVNCQYCPGDAWALKPYNQETFELVANQVSGFSAGVINPLDMTT